MQNYNVARREYQVRELEFRLSLSAFEAPEGKRRWSEIQRGKKTVRKYLNESQVEEDDFSLRTDIERFWRQFMADAIGRRCTMKQNQQSSKAGIETLEFDQRVGSLYVATQHSFDHVPVNLRGYAFPWLIFLPQLRSFLWVDIYMLFDLKWQFLFISFPFSLFFFFSRL